MTDSAEMHNSEEPHSEVNIVNPVPPFIKWGLSFFVFLVIIIAVTIVVFMPNDANDDISTSVDNADNVDVVALEDDLGASPLPDDVVRRDDVDEATSSIISNVPFSTPSSVQASIDSLEISISSIETNLSDATSLIHASLSDSKAVEKDVQRISVELNSLALALNELVSTVDDLSVQIAAQDEQVLKLSRNIPSSRKVANTHSTKPAFSLLSIDRWGDRDSIVLDLNGHVTTASVGDRYDGWTLKTIRTGCVDVERIKDRKTTSLCISKGGS
jgi:hypothetical protein